jgi:ABC-2 type transport system ATP-binding protein
VRVDVLDTAGQPLKATKPGEDVSIRVRVEATDRLEDWILGVGIDSPLGHVVYGTNTRLLGVPMPPLLGEGVFEVRLPHLWLGEGQYSVHGAIAEGSGVQVHRLIDAATFSVESDGHSIGYLHTQPEVRFG